MYPSFEEFLYQAKAFNESYVSCQLERYVLPLIDRASVLDRFRPAGCDARCTCAECDGGEAPRVRGVHVHPGHSEHKNLGALVFQSSRKQQVLLSSRTILAVLPCPGPHVS
jgi:hypothetical protein